MANTNQLDKKYNNRLLRFQTPTYVARVSGRVRPRPVNSQSTAMNDALRISDIMSTT
jgi:hypothetical protein